MPKAAAPESRGRFEKTGEFFAVQDGVAYGWAIVCTEKGQPYWDLQDDHIPEDEMTVAALDFMKNSRVGSDQHTGEHVGDIVFAFPVTKSSPALGLASDKTGLLIGYQPQDGVHLDMIKQGERTGFSIGGFLLDYDVNEVGKAVWSTAFQNNLPDSSFLYVKPGGKKDAEGKTVPRSLRMFPVKDADGKVDAPHLNNALARIPQSNLTAELKSRLTDKANGLKKADIGKGMPDPSDVYTPGEVGTTPKKRGKVYRRFKIDEISLVTKPAQEGATVGYVKSAPILAVVRKQVVVTSEDDGHQHVIDMDDMDDDGCVYTSCAIAPGKDNVYQYGHTHVVVIDPATRTLTITANAGHGHTAEFPDPTNVVEAGPPKAETVTLSAKAARSENSTSKIPTASVQSKSTTQTTETTMTEAEIAALQKRLERAEKMASLSDAHRAYAGRLSITDQDAFVAKNLTDRDAIVKAAVEYTATDGAVYYKHDDQRVVKMAKDNDELKKQLVVQEGVAKAARISKLAGEIVPNYPEDQATHEAVVGAIEAIGDEKVREAARKMLIAGNAAFTKTSTMRGVNPRDGKVNDGNQTELAKAETELKTAVETFGKANNIPSFEVAFAVATGKDEPTRKAFEKVRELRGTAQARE